MKKIILASLALMIVLFCRAQERKVVKGFDGGMMVHTGYLFGNLPEAGSVSGMPFGLGGVVRMHLGEHWRVGGEGYVSTLRQLGNGSYVRYGWGGLLADFYWQFGRFFPYAGLTVGGGADTNLIVNGDKVGDWEPRENVYFNKQGFLALAPFIGCDYAVSEAFHLTLKADWLNCISSKLQIPTGPRLFFGFIFYH